LSASLDCCGRACNQLSIRRLLAGPGPSGRLRTSFCRIRSPPDPNFGAPGPEQGSTGTKGQHTRCPLPTRYQHFFIPPSGWSKVDTARRSRRDSEPDPEQPGSAGQANQAKTPGSPAYTERTAWPGRRFCQPMTTALQRAGGEGAVIVEPRSSPTGHNQLFQRHPPETQVFELAAQKPAPVEAVLKRDRRRSAPTASK
jgi:hypothetical protein